MAEQERKDILEYKATLDLYKRTCQGEYRSAHPNCMTCELCDKREYWWRTCKVTGTEIGSLFGNSSWMSSIKANRCKYYTPHIDEVQNERFF